jgi:hypothetical protein
MKKQTFTIGAKIVLEVSITINASDFYEALSQSKELDEYDFVKILGEYMDGSFEVVGVSKDHDWPIQAKD